MDKTVYDKRAFRNLPRDFCLVGELLGEKCSGLIHLHHTDPTDPDSKLVPVCAHHHPKIHAALRNLTAVTGDSEKPWKRCPHRPGTHRYPGAKEACERRLNGVISSPHESAAVARGA